MRHVPKDPGLDTGQPTPAQKATPGATTSLLIKFRGLGFRGLGIKGFRGLGFSVLGFSFSGFRVLGV